MKSEKQGKRESCHTYRHRTGLQVKVSPTDFEQVTKGAFLVEPHPYHRDYGFQESPYCTVPKKFYSCGPSLALISIQKRGNLNENKRRRVSNAEGEPSGCGIDLQKYVTHGERVVICWRCPTHDFSLSSCTRFQQTQATANIRLCDR